jgi:isoleucyl-tRNA synthetase
VFAFNRGEFDLNACSLVLNLVATFLSQTMSALYFETVKDLLYSGEGKSRAGAAYTLHQVSRRSAG